MDADAWVTYVMGIVFRIPDPDDIVGSVLVEARDDAPVPQVTRRQTLREKAQRARMGNPIAPHHMPSSALRMVPNSYQAMPTHRLFSPTHGLFLLPKTLHEAILKDLQQS